MRSEAWERARALIRSHGWNTTCYQVLNPGFSLWFSARGDAVAGYIERHRVRVVGGAPACTADRLPAVLAELEDDARAAGRGVAYFAAESRIAALGATAPARLTFLIGAQPFWAPHALSARIETHASLRAQLHRAANKSVRAAELAAGEAQAREQELRRLLREWLEGRGLPPLHFLVETDAFHPLEDRRLWIAERGGVPVAFLVATPVPTRKGWLIEHIVRGRAAPNGTTELLLHAAAVGLADAELLTLGLAPLSRRAPAAVDPGPVRVRMLLAWLRAHGRRFYDFEGLDAFKAKFRPEWWEPVYTSLAPGVTVPRALLAVTSAFAGSRVTAFAARALAHALRQETRRLRGAFQRRR